MMMTRKELTRRDFLRASAGAAAGILATACVPTMTPAVAPEAEAVEEISWPPAPAEIRVSHWWGDYLRDQSGMIPIVEEKTGLKVQEEHLPFWEEKFLIELVSGVAPDSLMVGPGVYGVVFAGGLMDPLAPYIEAAQLDMSKFAVDQRIDSGYKGVVYALSIFFDEAVVGFINKTKADETGIKLPEWGTPEFDTWTWDDYVEFAKAATKIKADGTHEQYGDSRTWNDMWWLPDGVMHQHSGELMFDDGIWDFEEKETIINSPGNVAAVQATTDMVVKHRVSPTVSAQGMIEGGVYNSGLAMCEFSGSGLQAPTEWEVAMIALPWNTTRSHRYGGNGFTVNSNSDKKEQAAQFTIEMATDWDVQHVYAETAGQPAYETLEHIEQVKDPWFQTLHLIATSRVKGFSKCERCTEDFEWRPGWYGREFAFFRNRTTEAFETVLLGEKSVQEALDETADDINARLNA
jgi:ABC-type glycerol-3-phosphate transport system substrate-binding protein